MKKDERDKTQLFNPNINFNLYLFIELNKTNYKFIFDNIKLYDNKEEYFINRNYTFLKRISEFDIIILYDCKEENYSDYNQFLNYLTELNDNKTVNYYDLYFEYDGFTLDHQNNEKPVLTTEETGMIFRRKYKLNINESIEILHQWRGLFYTERIVSFKKKLILFVDILKKIIFIIIIKD